MGDSTLTDCFITIGLATFFNVNPNTKKGNILSREMDIKVWECSTLANNAKVSPFVHDSRL